MDDIINEIETSKKRLIRHRNEAEKELSKLRRSHSDYPQRRYQEGIIWGINRALHQIDGLLREARNGSAIASSD